MRINRWRIESPDLLKEIEHNIPLKPINPITVTLCAASKYLREALTTRSNREMSCCFAARCAARNLRTRSSIVSAGCCGLCCCGDGGGTAPLLCCGWCGWWLLDGDDCCFDVEEVRGEEDDPDPDFVFACGVLAVNRVASATVRGVLPRAAIVWVGREGDGWRWWWVRLCGRGGHSKFKVVLN